MYRLTYRGYVQRLTSIGSCARPIRNQFICGYGNNRVVTIDSPTFPMSLRCVTREDGDVAT